MTRHAYFDTRDSDYERFLSAPLWEETDGSPLSVMSAFARLGLEPWDEADRLWRLSQNSAASALAASLSRLPIVGKNRPDYASIATQLVSLLPERHAFGAAAKAPSLAAGTGWWLAIAAGVAVVLQLNGWLF